MGCHENTPLKRHEVNGATTPAFSPDGRILAFMQQKKGGEQALVIWFHTENRIQEISRAGPNEYFSGITFSPDGALLGACGGQSVQLWTVNPPMPRHSIPLSRDSQCGFGFTARNREIAYIDKEEIVTWDITEGRITTRNRPPVPPSPYSDGFDQSLSFFAVAPDGRTAIYQDSYQGISWWDLDRQAQLPGIEIPSQGSPNSVSFTPDSRLAAVDMIGTATLVDIARRMPLATYSIRSSGALSPDGRLIAVSGGGSVIALTETGAHEGVPVAATHVAVQPDNDRLAAVSSTGEVTIHSFGDPERIVVMPAAQEEVGSRRVEDLSPNGRRYAIAGGPAHHIRVRDILSSPASEVTLEGHRSEVLQLSFDPSSDFLASADASIVIVWTTQNQAEVSRIPLPKGYATTNLAVSPEGRYVAASSPDGKTLLWDTTSNELTGTPLPLDGTTSFTFSPDGRWLSIANQNEIRLWSLDAGQIDPRRIPISTARTIRFSPDNALLAALRNNNTSEEVTVWNVRDDQIAGTVIANSFGSLNAFAFTRDSARLVVAGQGVFLGRFDAPWALQHICRITGGNLTQEEWDRYAQGFDRIATCP